MKESSRSARNSAIAPTRQVGLLLALAVLSFGVPGCRETHIRSYTVPSERAQRSGSMPVSSMGGSPSPMAEAPGGGAVVPHWHLPPGWEEIPGSGMRYATIVVEPGEKPLEIRVTPLALAARDPLENVNRWRGQLGLDPIGQSQLGSVMKSATVDGFPVEIINMTGVSLDGKPADQILAAILTTNQQVWFFLMLDSAQRVAKYPAAFEEFIRGIHLSEHAESGAGAPAMMPPAGAPPGASGAAGSGEAMSWTVPNGWNQDPKAGDMRVASFQLPDGAGEVTITKFPGDVGGLLANINRWRKQLEMPPVAAPGEQPYESIRVAGQSAMLFDIVQPGDAGTRQRMLVALVARPDMTWFVKMTGSATSLDRQAPVFRTFVQSIQFQGDAQ